MCVNNTSYDETTEADAPDMYKKFGCKYGYGTNGFKLVEQSRGKTSISNSYLNSISFVGVVIVQAKQKFVESPFG